MLLADHLLAIALVVAGPLRSGTLGVRRLRQAAPEALPAVRCALYARAVWLQWTLAAGTLALWALARRPAAGLGLAPRLTGGMLGALVGTAIIVAVVLRQRRRALADPDGLAQVRERMRDLELLLPHGGDEWRAFRWLALTAGVCEELLYRGYLVWYFSHALGWWPSAAAAALAFGLGHAYQGPRGVTLTTLVGAFLSAVYYVSGSLYAGMVIHSLMDLHSGHLAWKAYEGERADVVGAAATDSHGGGPGDAD